MLAHLTVPTFRRRTALRQLFAGKLVFEDGRTSFSNDRFANLHERIRNLDWHVGHPNLIR